MRRLQVLVAMALVGALGLPAGAHGQAAQERSGSHPARPAAGVQVGYGPMDSADGRSPLEDAGGRPAAMPDAARLVHADIGAAHSLIRLVLEPDVITPDEAALAALDALGLIVLERDGTNVIAIADRRGAEAAIEHGFASWAEPLRPRRSHNEGAGAIVGAPIAAAAGLDGSGQLVAVADTGLGGGTAATGHRDIAQARVHSVERLETAGVFGCFAVLDDGSADVDSGHGTHVATTALGAGGPSGEGRGLAPGASLYFQSVEDYVMVDPLCEPFLDDGYALIGIPLDLAELLEPAYAAGARVHQDSWGAAVAGEYDASAADVDDFIHNHQDLTMVVSAGNEGQDANADGTVDPGSLSSPATAKNVIAVGASENARTSYPCDAAAYAGCAGGFNTIPAYGWPAEPYTSDLYAGGVEQVAAFSSRGPTTDGRIKPDVVAPGTWVLSGYSDMYQRHYDGSANPVTGLFQDDGWGDPYDQHYKYFGGTSMAAPIVSGAAAVIRQLYAESGSWNASAALVKATLINSATDLTDENNDGTADNAIPIPNAHEGWGRIDLAAATDGSHAWFDGDDVEAGMARTYATAVHSGTPLRVTLVWSDPAAAPGCSTCLVNDLDLELVAPDGSVYIGNNFASGWTEPGEATPDAVNNVENVYVADPTAGVWTMRVNGGQVPNGPQAFALVFDADFDTTIDVSPPTWPAAHITAAEITHDSVTLLWSPATDDTGVVGYDVYAGTTLMDTVSGTETTISDLQESTTYTFRVEARDVRGNRSVDGPQIVVSTDDGTAPQWTVDAGTVLDIGETWVRLGWDAPQDMSAIAEYTVTFGAESVRLDPSTLATTIAALAPATDYTIAITATDTAGNRSDALETRVRTATDFEDTRGHLFEDDIAWLSGMGITGGCAPTAYCPDAPMTRAQMASLLARALRLDPIAEDRFSDVSGVHAQSINAIAAAGISVGCGGVRFCPQDPVTRAQMATFLDRALHLDPTTVDYFSDDAGSVHEEAINRVAAAQITLGCGAESFCGSASVTRGQIAAFLRRALAGTPP